MKQQILSSLYQHRMRDPNDTRNFPMPLHVLIKTVPLVGVSELNSLAEAGLIELTASGIRITGTGVVSHLNGWYL